MFMKKVISLLKRAVKAFCNAYIEANTFKLDNGDIIYVSNTGTAYVC